MAKFRLAVVAAVVVPACSLSGPTPEEVAVPAPAPAQGGDDGCPRTECGGSGNSPVMDGVYFWNLNFNGTANKQGFSFLPESVRRNGEPASLGLGAPGDHLRVIMKAAPYFVYEHDHLEEITFLVRKDANGKLFQIRIDAVHLDQEPFWVGVGAVESYDVHFTPLNDPVLPREEHWLCSHPSDDPAEVTAIAFGGDIYDADTKEIMVDDRAAGWFNIACHMGAPWKMHMIGHTGVANFRLGITTSLDKRRAMLNAWTMNACGTGRAFTHPGEPITLQEQPDLLPEHSDYRVDWVSHEAVWGVTGALCLDAPRLWEEDFEIRSKIQAECGGTLPPPCGATWPVGGLVSTGNPPEPLPLVAASPARAR